MIFLPLVLAAAVFAAWYAFRRRSAVPGSDRSSQPPRAVVVWGVAAAVAVLLGLW